MRKNIITNLFVCFVISLVHGQADPMWNLEKLSNATVFLLQPPNLYGTGTIIIHREKIYLLTANHVASKMTSDSFLFFRGEGDKPIRFKLTDFIEDKNLSYLSHLVADISLFELSTKGFRKGLTERAFPSSQIDSLKLLPSRDEQIYFLGYPVIDVNLEYLSPITFRTTLASGLITQPRADTKTLSAFFFLNAPSMQGASGGGIYASVLNDMLYVGTATKLIGVVHGTTSDETGGKLSMNTPSFYVWELLRILK